MASYEDRRHKNALSSSNTTLYEDGRRKNRPLSSKWGAGEDGLVLGDDAEGGEGQGERFRRGGAGEELRGSGRRAVDQGERGG